MKITENRYGYLVAMIALSSLCATARVSPARAHFQELIPSADIVASSDPRVVTVDAVFTHPFARGPVMAMAPPKRVGVLVGERREDLAGALEARPVEGKAAYRVRYTLREPGDHVFFLEPAPYWEAAEKKMIIHYAKVVVDAFGAGEGWDRLVGLPVEIEPLTRPYGLWTGNQFRGVVRRNGKPVPFATVEVAWRNDGSVTAPAEPFTVQVMKADGNGVFAYSMPRAGWWGFAALIEGEETMTAPSGEPVPVEQGGLIWVRAVDMK